MATRELLCLILLVAGNKGDVFDYNFAALSSPSRFSDAIESFLLVNETAVSESCLVQLREYVVGLNSREEWALKMYDSTAKLPAGVLDGNLGEEGSFDECLYVSKLNDEPESGSLTRQYCLGSIFVNTTRNISDEYRLVHFINKLSFSTCLPDGCSPTDVQNVFRGIGFNFTAEAYLCQTSAARPALDTRAIIGLTVFACLALLMVASTIYDLRNKFIEKSAPNSLLAAFSIYTNLKKIFNTKSGTGEITCLHGIRSIAICIVITSHSYYFSMFLMHKNGFYINEYVHEIQNMPIVKGDVCMDIFLFMSGTMITLGYFHKRAKQQKFRILTFYASRYLRLITPLATVILFVATVLKYLGSGPVWPIFINVAVDPCVQHWWCNMLHIQTYILPTCLTHTWYTAVDYQLFLLSPLLLLPMNRWTKKSLVATALLAACCVAATFAFAWMMEFRAAAVFNRLNYGMYSIYYYNFSPSRASPWLIGLIFGYFLHMSNNNPNPLRKATAQRILFVALVICFGHVFGAAAILNASYNRWISSFYISVSTTAFVISLAWIIYCCKLGYAGPVNSFLSCAPFKIVSKLTHCIYLVQNVVICYSAYTARVPPFLGEPEMIVHRIPGNLLYCFLVALVLCISVELPTQTFVSAFLKT